MSDLLTRGRTVTLSPTSKSAVISDCGTYRYQLKRVWNEALPLLVYVMLNPSTADHTVDDPTILRCMGFARRLGYGGIVVVNLFAFRSSRPADMQAAADPVGPLNDEHIAEVLVDAYRDNAMVICAWGTGGGFKSRDVEVGRLIEDYGLVPFCLGRTKDLHPKHPLARGHHRIPDDAVPIPLVTEGA
jgi:hypothetical protein